MRVEIIPGIASGTVQAPPSKSMAHRCLIAAALAKGVSTVRGIAYSQDILATIDCLRALGVRIVTEGSTVTVCGGTFLSANEPLVCRESGSTLRFMLPLCLLSGKPATLKGSERLMERPLSVYENLCLQNHFDFSRENGCITVCGKLESGTYFLDGIVSSQFITGLLFALTQTEGESTIVLNGKIESRSYIDLTVSALQMFGFAVAWEGDRWLHITGGSGHALDCTVEGDYSNAAFFDALNLFNGSVSLTGLKKESLQGDRIYREYFRLLEEENATLSLENCPDLGPILFVVAALKNGGIFEDTARLKIKESDRGVVMAEELKKFGVKLQVEENRIIVPGGAVRPSDELICGHNDHRIVMAMSILSTVVGGVIEGAQAVTKSMPDFFEQLSSLGIEVRINETE